MRVGACVESKGRLWCGPIRKQAVLPHFFHDAHMTFAPSCTPSKGARARFARGRELTQGIRMHSSSSPFVPVVLCVFPRFLFHRQHRQKKAFFMDSPPSSPSPYPTGHPHPFTPTPRPERTSQNEREQGVSGHFHRALQHATRPAHPPPTTTATRRARCSSDKRQRRGRSLHHHKVSLSLPSDTSTGGAVRTHTAQNQRMPGHRGTTYPSTLQGQAVVEWVAEAGSSVLPSLTDAGEFAWEGVR